MKIREALEQLFLSNASRQSKRSNLFYFQFVVKFKKGKKILNNIKWWTFLWSDSGDVSWSIIKRIFCNVLVISGFCNVPARGILTFMGFLAIINGESKFFLLDHVWLKIFTAYTMRSVLNISITEMVYRQGHNETIHDNTCPVPGGGYVPVRDGFMWSQKLQGVILGSFYWGYVSRRNRIMRLNIIK